MENSGNFGKSGLLKQIGRYRLSIVVVAVISYSIYYDYSLTQKEKAIKNQQTINISK